VVSLKVICDTPVECHIYLVLIVLKHTNPSKQFMEKLVNYAHTVVKLNNERMKNEKIVCETIKPKQNEI